MDISAAEALGALLGTGAATFVASWAASLKSTKKELTQPAKDLNLLNHRMTKQEEESKSQRDTANREIEKLETRLKSLEDKVSGLVTTEEFTAYVDRTTESVNNLNEKVGRVTGAIEVWARSKNY